MMSGRRGYVKAVGKRCTSTLQVVVEPSGAAGLAAVLSTQFRDSPVCGPSQRVGVILCGGNADFAAVNFWQSWLALS